MSNFEIRIGQAAYLTRGLNSNWSPAEGRLDILYTPPEAPLETTEVSPSAEHGTWKYPAITLHDDAQSLLTALLPYEVVSPSAELDASSLPAGALILGAARNPAALDELSKTLGVNLSNPDFGYALVKLARHDEEISHVSHVGEALVYSRPRSPSTYAITENFYSAMTRLRSSGIGVPEGWGERYNVEKVNEVLEFQRTYGTHYVSKVLVGDTIFQVFAYTSEKFTRVKRAYASQPDKLSGPDAVDFVYFTTDLNKGDYGYVTEFGKILNLSHCQAFQHSQTQGQWYEPNWSKRPSVFALFKPDSLLNLAVLNRDFKDQAPTSVTLASMGVLIEYKRGLYWQRVLKAALAQKYEDKINVIVRVTDERDFDQLLPEDVPGLLSTIATPTINVYKGRLDLSRMQLVAADQVKDFSLLTQVLSSGDGSPVSIPGDSVRLFAQIFDLRARKTISTWTLADKAFVGAEIVCDEFLGGLALRNQSQTAYSFILDGLKFGLKGEGRNAEPTVVADLRSHPSEEALPSLVQSLQFAMNFMEAVLGYPCMCSDSNAPCIGTGIQEFARTGCEWFAHFIPPSVTDPELLALRVQALGLARYISDPAYGAFVPILPAERYEIYVAKILDYLDAIQQEIQRQEQQIAMRKQAELIIHVGQTLNQNIIESGQLLKGLIDASRAQQQDLAGYYDSVITQLGAEAKVQSSKVDQLNVSLLKAKNEVDFRIQKYRSAAEQQTIADVVKFGLDVATQLFAVGVTIANPSSTLSSVKELGTTAQKIQKTLNAINATYTLYSTISKEVHLLQNVSKVLDDLDGGQFGSESTLPWDELSIAFKAVMALGPTGDLIKQAQAELQSAFDIMVLRGKAVASAQSSLSQLQRDIYTNRRQKQLGEDQAQRLARLDTALRPAQVQDLDKSAIDLVGLTGDLYAIQMQMLTTLSSAFLLQDQALQYANLQPPTVITSFSLLTFRNARVRQEAAKIAALSALAQLQTTMTTPIPYVIEGVPVEQMTGGEGLQVCIGIDAKEFLQYVDARVIAVVAEIEGTKSTQSGRMLVQLDYGGSPFMNRTPQRDRLHFHTPGRGRTYEYNATTGERFFTDGGRTWSEGVSRISPFSRWTVSFPQTELNKGITFASPHVNVRLLFVLEARIVDTSVVPRRVLLARERPAVARMLTSFEAQVATVPTKDALVAAMFTQGSCTNNWDVVFNMALGQINNALQQQYKEFVDAPGFQNVIQTETRSHVQGKIYAIKRFNIRYGYPVMTFMTNNNDTVKLQMQILEHSTIESCVEMDGQITCDPPATISGETMTATIKLSLVSGMVSGTNVLCVQLEMEKGTFTVENIDLSDDELIEFNKALKSYFANNKVTFLINKLDITSIPTLESLRPNGFRFKTLKTPSAVDVLQLYIQTGARALLDASQLFLNNVPEPLPDGQECSMMIRSQLFYSEILPKSLQQKGWEMKGVEATTTNGAWTGVLTKAPVQGNVDLSKLHNVQTSTTKNGSSRTVNTYSIKGGNPLNWSLESIPIKSRSDGKMVMSGQKKNTMTYTQQSSYTYTPCFFNCEPRVSNIDLQTDVDVNADVTMPLEVSGSGRDQQISINTSSKNVNITGNLSGGGPCGSDDLDAQVNQQIRDQIPSQIESSLNVPFESISVFALKNLLFPSDNYIKFTAAYAPGDVLLIGIFQQPSGLKSS